MATGPPKRLHLSTSPQKLDFLEPKRGLRASYFFITGLGNNPSNIAYLKGQA